MRPHLKLWVFALIISIVSRNLETSGLTLKEDGGYDITLAIKNDEPRPTNVNAYINNIKGAFTTLSEKMWIATRENFFIRSLEIILPQSWGVAGDVRSISYVTADIRVSSGQISPYVENSNLCGLPGSYIELPRGFFDSANSGSFGENWKVLLVEWARYRWGAYEEHGTPGDKMFPYFTRDFQAEENDPKWLLNGCTNAPDNKLVGEYRKLDGTVCDPTWSTKLDSQCRFHPDKNANFDVTSSLMHFHFMDSVYQFCDATTHQKHVPTKQNIYCDHKSVMETIESSPDYKAIDPEKKPGYVPNLKTKVSVAPSKPAIYILLDNTKIEAHASVLHQVIPLLGKFFNDVDVTVHNDLMVGVGQFPSEETRLNLKPTVPVALLSKNRDQVVQAIRNYQANFIESEEDFGMAIQQAAAAIRAVSPVEGGNILFLKNSPARDYALGQGYTPEKELELALRRDNIKLFALEIVDVNKTRQNLAQIATASSGDSIALSVADLNQIPLVVPAWLEQKVLAEYGTPPMPNRPERIIYSGYVSQNTNYSIPVLAGTTSVTFIVLATDERLNATSLFAGVSSPQGTIRANFIESNEYGQTETRLVYTAILDMSVMTSRQVTFNYSDKSDFRHYLTVLSDGAQLPEDISVTVHTSSNNNSLDYGNFPNPDAPFVISAIVTQNNVPVIGAEVHATISQGNGNKYKTQLLDEPFGLSNPAGDGVYSAIFIPRNGNYSISVVVTIGNANVTTTSVLFGGSTLLLPPDQTYQPVESVEFPRGALITGNLGSIIHVTNEEKFVDHIQTIRDLSVREESMYNEEVTFELSVPKRLTFGYPPYVPDRYRFYMSESYDLLINLDTENLQGGVTMALQAVGPYVAGAPFSVNYTRSVKTTTLHFAVVSFYISGQRLFGSNVSNIVTLPSIEDQGPVETTTTDKTEPNTSTEKVTPPPEEPEEGKPWIKSTGGIITIVVIVLVCFAVAGGGYWYMNKRRAGRSGSNFATSA